MKSDVSVEEQAVGKVVDEIWAKYDVDGSGDLDKDETKQFVEDTLCVLGSSDQFSDEVFEAIYKDFDVDGSGTIDRDEL